MSSAFDGGVRLEDRSGESERKGVRLLRDNGTGVIARGVVGEDGPGDGGTDEEAGGIRSSSSTDPECGP